MQLFEETLRPRAFAGGSATFAGQALFRFLSLANGGALVHEVMLATQIANGVGCRMGIVHRSSLPDSAFLTVTECKPNIETAPIASGVTFGQFVGTNPLTPGGTFPLLQTGGFPTVPSFQHRPARPIYVPRDYCLQVSTLAAIAGLFGVTFTWSELIDVPTTQL